MIWSKKRIELNATDVEVLLSEPFQYEWTKIQDLAKDTSPLPPVYSAALLVLLCDHPYDAKGFWRRYRELLEHTNHAENHYTIHKIKKHNGKMRYLYQPDSVLEGYQRWILRNILQKIRISEYATAYRKNYSVKNNSLPHMGQRTVVKLDISNFFDSITEPMVYSALEEATNYPKEALTLLTKICCYQKKLPQGAVTSPMLANIVMRTFDEKTQRYCSQKGINYTRYSDDLTFSAELIDVSDLIRTVKSNLNLFGFRLSREKIKALGAGMRHEVTGVVCNEQLSVSADYRRKIRQEVYYLTKHGIEGHLQHLQNTSFVSEDGTVLRDRYLNNLLGRISYVLHIDPDNQEFRDYRKAIEDIRAIGCSTDQICEE